MSPISRNLFASVATLVTAAACSSSHIGEDAAMDAQVTEVGPSDGSSTVDSGVDADAPDPERDAGVDLARVVYDFCVQRARLLCDGNAACCEIASRQYEGGECDEESIEEGCRLLSEDPALGDGTLEWDAVEATRVLEALSSALPDCDPIEQFSYRQVLMGRMAEGEECTPETSSGPGAFGRFRCEPDLRCELVGSFATFTGTCAPKGTAGDSCLDFLGDCESGFWCDSTAPTGDVPYEGLCEPQLESDEMCGWDHSCTTVHCDRSEFHCDAPTAPQTWCRRLG